MEKVCEMHLLIYYKNINQVFNLLNKFKLLILKFNIMTSNPIRPSEIERADEFIVIDVRESDELSDGNIENSMHLPLGSIIRNARQCKLHEYKDKNIVTYCNSGYRGNIAAEELSKLGFKVFNLEGGFQGWMKSRK